MGQAKLRKAEINMIKGRNTVRHITKHSWFNTIVDQNVLELEGSNTHAIPNMPGHHDFLQLQYNLVGRYVWFTKQRHAKCAGAASELYFEFDQDEMKFEHWPDVVASLSGKARLLAEGLNVAAKSTGDDPDQWYVSRTPVSLDKCLNKTRFPEMRKQAEMIDRNFQERMRELERQGLLRVYEVEA